jgi:hypothetical protein
MSDQNDGNMEITAFIQEWQGEDQPMRNWFQLFFDTLTAMDDVTLEFVARPGVSYSIRPKHKAQTERNLFAMVDVIDDDPADRWLSVCFYGDMITDPEERGEVIPGGLAGSDGYCFDMYDNDETLAHYLVERMKEGYIAAG